MIKYQLSLFRTTTQLAGWQEYVQTILAWPSSKSKIKHICELWLFAAAFGYLWHQNVCKKKYELWYMGFFLIFLKAHTNILFQSFSFQNNPKNLDPSYKMDLDLWIVSEG